MIFLWSNIVLLLISLLCLIFIKKLPFNFIIYDKPDKIRKIHSSPVPLIGGGVFYIFLVFNLIFFSQDLNLGFKLLSLLIFLYSFFFILGFIDDKSSLSASKKTIYILVILFLVIPLHDKLIINEIVFRDIDIDINLKQANIFFTIFSIYFFYNLVNFSDGANGITLSLSIFWIIVFISSSSINETYLYTLIAPLVLIFLFNVKNKIFIGNSGSNLLSIFLASLFIFNYNIDKSLKCDEILILMFLPAIDAIRVIFDRIIVGNSPLRPDRNHLHHLLLKKFENNIVFIPYIIMSISPFIFSIYFNTVIIFIISLFAYFGTVLFLKRM